MLAGAEAQLHLGSDWLVITGLLGELGQWQEIISWLLVKGFQGGQSWGEGVRWPWVRESVSVLWESWRAESERRLRGGELSCQIMEQAGDRARSASSPEDSECSKEIVRELSCGWRDQRAKRESGQVKQNHAWGSPLGLGEDPVWYKCLVYELSCLWWVLLGGSLPWGVKTLGKDGNWTQKTMFPCVIPWTCYRCFPINLFYTCVGWEKNLALVGNMVMEHDFFFFLLSE